MTNPTSEPHVWFITGCSTGFGRELAKAVLARGERVVVTARDVEQVQDFEQSGPELARAFPLDVTDLAEVSEAVDHTLDAFGRIDVLVNNAGYGSMGAVEEVHEEEIRRQFEVNVIGVLNVTRAVLPHMREMRSGHVVNISSVGGFVGVPGFGIYNGTKFAVEGISEALAQEVEPLGIRVTIVEPGAFRTDWAGRADPRVHSQRERQPAGQPEASRGSHNLDRGGGGSTLASPSGRGRPGHDPGEARFGEAGDGHLGDHDSRDVLRAQRGRLGVTNHKGHDENR